MTLFDPKKELDHSGQVMEKMKCEGSKATKYVFYVVQNHETTPGLVEFCLKIMYLQAPLRVSLNINIHPK